MTGAAAPRPAAGAGSTSHPILQLRSVTRVHGEGALAVRALGPLNLDVQRGEFVAVMGPSGSGKSTMLGLAGALDQPNEGTVSVLGHDLATIGAQRLAELRRRVIGYVFQDFNLLPGLSALENVALPLELDGARPRDAWIEARKALEDVQLDHLAARYPDDLSGGEKQRVAVARACVGPRQILLADEPTGALDTVTSDLVMRLMRAQCDAGRTAILVTHDAGHAAWADRILFLRDGRIVDETGRAARDRASRA
ncbi:MAG: ABC transporter ATP-binding protein [Planctomycetota bacterium]